MFIGSAEFRSVAAWLDGVDFAYDVAYPEEFSDLFGFAEWLLVNIGGPANQHWMGIIRESFGDGKEATQRFFELFDLFRGDVSRRGLKAILREHYDFEMRTYGSVRASKYFAGGWDKKLSDSDGKDAFTGD
jgi:hypothetical protein